MNKPHHSGLTCNHAEIGLCRQCSEEYDIDPLAFHEFGPHPAGDHNSERLAQEITAEAAAERAAEELQAAEDRMQPVPGWDESIPF